MNLSVKFRASSLMLLHRKFNKLNTLDYAGTSIIPSPQTIRSFHLHKVQNSEGGGGRGPRWL